MIKTKQAVFPWEFENALNTGGGQQKRHTIENDL